MTAPDPPSGRRLRYCVVRPDSADAIESVSRVLRGSGVRIDRVNRRAARIKGMIDSPEWGVGCKVVVSLFPRTNLCFIEIACEGSGETLLTADLEALRLARDLRGSLPPRDSDDGGIRG